MNPSSAQYAYEREHRARILRSADGAARTRAYVDAYTGLAAGIRSGDFVNEEVDPERKAAQKFRLLRRFLRASDVVAEIGPGEYFLANIVAEHAALLHVVDVVPVTSEQVSKRCKVHKSDGTRMPPSLKNLNMVWSAHVLEHIHPKALHQHLCSVKNALTHDGYYVIFTPNRFTGPHDISKRDSFTAQGLHLKEYTVTELRRAMLHAGFGSIRYYAGGRGAYLRVPVFAPLLIEWILNLLPRHIARRCAHFLPFRAILGIILVGRNGGVSRGTANATKLH